MSYYTRRLVDFFFVEWLHTIRVKVNGPLGHWVDAVVASPCNLELLASDLAPGTSTNFFHVLRIVGPVGMDVLSFNEWTDERITIA